LPTLPRRSSAGSRAPAQPAAGSKPSTSPATHQPQFGFGQVEYQYLRCRLVSGRPDVSPPIARVEVNTVEVEQAVPALTSQPSTEVGPCPDDATHGGVELKTFVWRLLTALDGRRT